MSLSLPAGIQITTFIFKDVQNMGQSLEGAVLPSLFWYGSCPPVSLLSVGMCGNSYYDISLPEMISLPSLCSNLISAPCYGIQLAISFNFTIRENKKERTPPSFLVRQQQDRSKVSARWKHSFTFMHTEYKI